jgi:hypothetical protein
MFVKIFFFVKVLVGLFILNREKKFIGKSDNQSFSNHKLLYFLL